jgi:hypothetical protein
MIRGEKLIKVSFAYDEHHKNDTNYVIHLYRPKIV